MRSKTMIRRPGAGVKDYLSSLSLDSHSITGMLADITRRYINRCLQVEADLNELTSPKRDGASATDSKLPLIGGVCNWWAQKRLVKAAEIKVQRALAALDDWLRKSTSYFKKPKSVRKAAFDAAVLTA